MRWWDARARVHAGLLATHALVLGAMLSGSPRRVAFVATGLLILLIVRSFRFGPPPSLFLSAPPKVEGGLFLGRGFEWTSEAAQEALDSERAVWPSDGDLILSDEMINQHALILGTTGVGKTRLLELLALQAIARGDAVIVIDPKGDAGLQRRLTAAAGPRFQLFSLPHPERSVRYNPVGRYRDPREIADRIAGLLPSTGDALPFRNFAWEITHVAARQIHGHKPMTLRNLKQGAIDRPAGPLADRPREHHLKMASALIPLLSKLATPQLSPEGGGLEWERVDRRREVVYFSLGSLLGFETASAVARLATSDLLSYIGERYAFGKGSGPIWLLVDELADVVTPELIALLNKSRGAGLRVVACAQTVADLEAALGSRPRAQQVLGNVNTVIQFRAPGSLDAGLFSDRSGDRLLRIVSEGTDYEPALMGSGLRTVDDFRARFGERWDRREQPLVPPRAIVDLETFHFFGRWSGRIWRGRIGVVR